MLNSFFNPKSIAVVGASRKKEKLGSLVYGNIKKYGFSGKLYGVNVKGGKIGLKKLYKNLADIGTSIDLAVIVVPAKAVPAVVRDCGKKGIRAVVIISAGFSEVGGEGKKLEKAVLDVAREYDIRILGPNCLGIIDSWSKMNASFAESMPDRMKISLFSQSGAICTSILDWASHNGIGFSRFISLGNKLDIDENDVMDFLFKDEKTKVVLAYLESIHDGRKFMENARQLSKKKPLIIVKAGKTKAGAKTVSSHTGSIAGTDTAVKAAFRQSGVIQAESLEDLFDMAKVFAFSPEMKGNRVAVISNAGGPAVMAADAIDRSSLALAGLSSKVGKVLEENLPSESAKENPIDVLGDALSGRYELAINEVVEDENVHGMLVILTPQIMTEAEKTARIIVKVKKYGKPILACFIGGDKVEKAKEILEEGEIPVYDFPERAVKALEALYNYHKFKVSSPASSVYQHVAHIDKDKAGQIIQGAFSERVKYITEGRKGALDVFDAYNIETVKRSHSSDWEGLKKEASKIGYPLVLKTAAAGILHRTEIGGVAVGIEGKKDLAEAYNLIRDNIRKSYPKREAKAVSVYKMEKDGVEIFLGAKRDSSFGPMIIFGMGGIYVEEMKDFSYAIAPISRSEAIGMINAIKSAKIFHGYRGKPKCDIDKIVRSIVGLSQMMLDFPEIKEIDINPLKVTDKKCVAVDGKIILDM